MTPRFQPSHGAAYGDWKEDLAKAGKDLWAEHGDEITKKGIEVGGDVLKDKLKGDGKKPAKKKKPEAPAERSTTGRTLPAGSDTLSEWLEAQKAQKAKKMLAIGAGATALVIATFMFSRK